MASAVAPFPIYYNPDVHNFYMKQKHEFHFNQKSDNEFLMFLLDTAVRVISIVQHLAPVIEAVSDASPENIEDAEELFNDTSTTADETLTGLMDVDATTSLLSVELQQINQEITSAQNSSHSLSQTASSTLPASLSTSCATTDQNRLNSTIEPDPVVSSEILPSVPNPPSETVMQTASAVPNFCEPHIEPENSLIATEINLTPKLQNPSCAQPSENIPTTLPSVTQPVADAAADVKNENSQTEVIEIKEEFDDNKDTTPELVTSSDLQSLMSSISSSASLQNFVPTATPSSLPPSFFDRGVNNPLTMVGSISTGDGPGASGLNTSDNIAKNLGEGGLDVSNLKGQANPKGKWKCGLCGKRFVSVYVRKTHILEVHQQGRIYECKTCSKTFSRHGNLLRHHRTVHGPRNSQKTN